MSEWQIATASSVTSTSAPGPVMDEDTATTTAPPTDPGQVDGDAPGESQQQLPPEEYWRELALHRFLLAPRGPRVQSAKMAEAHMFLLV